MRDWILSVAIALTVALGGSYALRTHAYAQGAASVAPIDAGPAGGLITSPALATTPIDIADPLDDPGGLYRDAVDARARDGWPALVIVVLFAIARAARGKVAFLREGANAAYTAAGLTVLGALIDWRLGGGTWTTMVAAILGAIALLFDPAKPMTASLGGGKSPGDPPRGQV